MDKGERWKKFLIDKGWLVNDVISGGQDGNLKITLCASASPESRKAVTIESALLHPEYDILCYETPGGTVFFQWDDISQVMLEIDKKKKGWL